MEDMMTKLRLMMLFAAAAIATPAAAHDTVTAFANRGACESASAAISNAEAGGLLANFPQFFDSRGEVSSFLTRAWTCDRSGADGQYYMVDHVAETLGSDWFQQRNH
jgi:hypothetical protein